MGPNAEFGIAEPIRAVELLQRFPCGGERPLTNFEVLIGYDTHLVVPLGINTVEDRTARHSTLFCLHIWLKSTWLAHLLRESIDHQEHDQANDRRDQLDRSGSIQPYLRVPDGAIRLVDAARLLGNEWYPDVQIQERRRAA